MLSQQRCFLYPHFTTHSNIYMLPKSLSHMLLKSLSHNAKHLGLRGPRVHEWRKENMRVFEPITDLLKRERNTDNHSNHRTSMTSRSRAKCINYFNGDARGVGRSVPPIMLSLNNRSCVHLLSNHSPHHMSNCFAMSG